MGFFKKVTKPFKKVGKAVRKIIPKEIRPALPFLAAATPFLLPGAGIASLPFASNPAVQRGILSSLANIGSQATMDPEGDINLLSAAMAGLTGAGTTEGFGDTLRGMTTKGGFSNLPAGGATMPGLTEKVLADRGFFTKAADLGLTGAAKAADFLSGSRETLEALGSGTQDLFTKAGAKAAGKAAAIPLAQGTGDLAYATATAAIRDFEKAQAEELAQAGLDEAAIANARRAAIREAMEVSGFTEEDILETFDEIGLKDGGRVGLREGGLLQQLTAQNFIPGLGFSGFRPLQQAQAVFPRLNELEQGVNRAEGSLNRIRNRLGEEQRTLAGLASFQPAIGLQPALQPLNMARLPDLQNQQTQVLPSGTARGMKDGGMMDLQGKEMDLRGGGFVPIGKKEKADDVPARLSKNEFVMTADAVRAAGGGSVNKGAQRMYDLMNNLEGRA